MRDVGHPPTLLEMALPVSTMAMAAVPFIPKVRPGGSSDDSPDDGNSQAEIRREAYRMDAKLLPLVWVVRFFLMALCGTTLIMQFYEFSIGTLLEFSGLLLLVLIIWDVVIVSMGSKGTGFLFVSITQSVIFVVLLSIFLVTLNAWIYQFRGVPVNADLQVFLDFYPGPLVDTTKGFTNIAANFGTGVAATLFTNYILPKGKGLKS